MKVRSWFGGGVPPQLEVLLQAEAADAHPVCLYAVTDGVVEGEWVPVVDGLRAKLEAVRDDPGCLRAYTAQKSRGMFAAALFGLADSRQRRARVLQQLGVFTFGAGDEEAKARAARILDDRRGGGPEAWAALGEELVQVWEPRGLLMSVLDEPSAVAGALVSRLDAGHGSPVVIIGHSFAGVDRGLLGPLAQANAVAYERDAEIHVVTAVGEALEAWDADTQLQVGPESFSLLEVLVIHEIVELILDETTQLDPVASHLVADTFGRCLRDTMLAIAVEAFCLDWLETVPEAPTGAGPSGGGVGTDPDLSAEEAAEAQRAAASRTSDEERDLLEEMFEKEPEDAGATESSSASPATAPRRPETQRPAPQRPAAARPASPRAVPPEPVIRSAAGGGGEDLAGMFDAEDDAQPSQTPAAAPAGAGESQAAGEAEARRKRSYKIAPLEGKEPKVLVVDDSSMTRHLVCEVAQKLGYQTAEAVDGVQAVVLARYHKPDLIILDIAMPGGNGLTALRGLRAHPDCATTPIIMLTVESGRQSIRSAIQQGATDYLIKPVNVKELSKRMVQHLGGGGDQAGE